MVRAGKLVRRGSISTRLKDASCSDCVEQQNRMTVSRVIPQLTCVWLRPKCGEPNHHSHASLVFFSAVPRDSKGRRWDHARHHRYLSGDNQVNNNGPDAIAPSARPLARAVAAGLVCLTAASWVAPASANVVTEWNAIALSCIPRGGPANALDVSLVQAAVHDAVQAIEKRYEPYLSSPAAVGTESKAAAAAAAAYWVLTDNRVCPDTAQPTLDAAFLPWKNGIDPGLVVGKAAADAVLATEYRADNGAVWNGSTGVGEWRPTPPGLATMAFVYVATARPF